MFRDREEAGRVLGRKLNAYQNRSDVLVLALPRGGVVTGHAVARELRAPLEVLIVRKMGIPGQPELAIGAVAETGSVVLNRDIIAGHGLSARYIEAETERQKEEIVRRVGLYREGRKLGSLKGRTIVLVDDGVATGATVKAAVAALEREHPAELIVGLPVAPPETAAELGHMVDQLICLEMPPDFTAVGEYYENFRQTTDREVIELLHSAAEKAA